MNVGPVGPPPGQVSARVPAGPGARADPVAAPAAAQAAPDPVDASTTRVPQPQRPTGETTRDQKELDRAVSQMNEILDLFSVEARFEIHRDPHVVQVVLSDKRTNEVIRKIPPDEVLRRRAMLPAILGSSFDVVT